MYDQHIFFTEISILFNKKYSETSEAIFDCYIYWFNDRVTQRETSIGPSIIPFDRFLWSVNVFLCW